VYIAGVVVFAACFGAGGVVVGVVAKNPRWLVFVAAVEGGAQFRVCEIRTACRLVGASVVYVLVLVLRILLEAIQLGVYIFELVISNALELVAPAEVLEPRSRRREVESDSGRASGADG